MIEITVPVLNEEKNLRRQIVKLRNWFKEHFNEFTTCKIIIADNGSNDQTEAIAKEIVNEYKEIKYIRLEEKGVGLALQTSWRESKADIIGYMDLDLATNLNHFKEAIQPLENGYDLVYGSRLHPKSIVNGRSIIREISSRCFNLILRMYLNVRFSDGMCGFKFLKKEKYDALYIHGAQSKGWFFSTELLVLAEKLNYKIYELPVEWTDNDESHVRIIPLTIQYIKAMRRLKGVIKNVFTGETKTDHSVNG
jgi:glycosyltransferase involved in cell wall biosynthesis